MGSGRIGAHRGSGTLTFLLPALTANEQAQVCTMGELAWTIERTDGEDFPFKSAMLVQRADGRTITRTALGETRSDATIAPAEAGGLPPIRHYRGRTSQGLPMVARTRRADTGIAVQGLFEEDQGAVAAHELSSIITRKHVVPGESQLCTSGELTVVPT